MAKTAYKKMVSGMLAKQKTKRPQKSDLWNVYILRCADGTFYTGIAKDAKKRLETHNSGKGARYTRTRLPVKLLYLEFCKNRTLALKRELEIKNYTRQKKKDLIKNGSPQC